MADAAQWPGEWVGWWVAEDGKAVRIDPGPQVTVAPARDAEPYITASAICERDEDGLHLEIEAGIAGLGPAYRLYPTDDGAVLRPQTVMGLYDDYDDDLGVPWAYPLLPLVATGRGPR